jgi:Rps23 Pro-64 3,4-dihydroxylase Tpa1-like proline 4-hydroxylase
MPDPLQEVVDRVNSRECIAYLERLTGIDRLIADPSLMGGGLNAVAEGDFLRVHADFNFNNDLKAYRVINALIYLNKDWDDAYGGGLELWDYDSGELAKTITPLFNRVVVFTTTSRSRHGYPPVRAPHGRVRKSLNFYFYRMKPLPDVQSQPHKTLWGLRSDGT